MSKQSGLVPNVKKIAVLRANAIGDFIFSLPALQALKESYPTAELVLLGRKWHVDFLATRPNPVNRAVEIPPSALREDEGVAADPQETEPFFARMAREEFDIAIQIHGGGKHSNPFLKRLGAKLNIGLKTPDAESLDRYIPYIYYQPEILRYLEVAELIGAKPVTVQPCLEVTARDLAEAHQILPEDHQALIIFHPGAGAGHRRWPTSNFVKVGDILAKRGFKIGVIGTEPERPIIEQILKEMQQPGINLCNKLSLSGLAGLLSQAALVISNDSGPLHLAAAVGTPTVGLFWFVNIITASVPYRANHRPLISWQTNCPKCGINAVHNKCGHSDSLIGEISVENVLEAAELLV